MNIKKQFSMYEGLPRSVYVLFVAIVINRMGSFVFPFMSLFLMDKLMMDPSKAGFFVALFAFSSVPGMLIGGKFVDSFGRKKILVIFQIASALCFLPCAFLGNSMIIPWLLILSGVLGGAVQPAHNAMMADLTNCQNRKAAFSLLYLGINVGFAVGSIVAGFLYRNYTKWIFLGNAIALAITVLLIVFFIEETMPGEECEEVSNELEKAVEGSIGRVLLERPIVIAFAVLSIAYSFAYSQSNFALTLQLKDVFMADASKVLGVLNSVNCVIVISLTTYLIHHTKRNSPILNVALAGLFFAVGFGMIYFIKGYGMFILSTIIWTIGEILQATNSGVFIADHAPSSHRGRFNSIVNITSNIGYFIGPYIMGRYIQAFGVRMVWPLVFGILILTVPLMYLLYTKEKNKTIEDPLQLSIGTNEYNQI